MAQHAAAQAPRHAPTHELLGDPRLTDPPIDEQTEDLADCIETAIGEIAGESPLYHAVSVHAARAVQLWIDFQLQRDTLRPMVTTMLDIESTTDEIPGVRWSSEAAPIEPGAPTTADAAPTPG